MSKCVMSLLFIKSDQKLIQVSTCFSMASKYDAVPLRITVLLSPTILNMNPVTELQTRKDGMFEKRCVAAPVQLTLG